MAPAQPVQRGRRARHATSDTTTPLEPVSVAKHEFRAGGVGLPPLCNNIRDFVLPHLPDLFVPRAVASEQTDGDLSQDVWSGLDRRHVCSRPADGRVWTDVT